MSVDFNIFSVAALALNIFTLIYFFGYWKGQVDVKVSTLWSVYTAQALSRESLRRGGGSKHMMPIPAEVKKQIDAVKCEGYTTPGDAAFKLIRGIGVSPLMKLAQSSGSSFEDYFGYLLVESDICRVNGFHPEVEVKGHAAP